MRRGPKRNPDRLFRQKPTMRLLFCYGIMLKRQANGKCFSFCLFWYLGYKGHVLKLYCRMDLFDLGTYFGSYAPVRALNNPLLKYAICAFAAKQLGLVKVKKAPAGGACSNQSALVAWAEKDKRDGWYWVGAKYYDKAIQLLMKELQRDEGPPPLSTPEAFGQWQAAELCEDNENPRKRRRRYLDSHISNGVHSDEVLAATAILSVYEFLDATGPAWNRHLSGVKSLLDVAEVGVLPLEQRPLADPAFPAPKRSGLSKARKAIFWNFARQDYLAACKCSYGMKVSGMVF